MPDWLVTSWSTLGETVASALLIFTVILIIVRVAGLRTFAKMSSIDFATTIAIGSILASVVMSGTTSVVQGIVGLVTIVAFQQVFAGLKFRSNAFEEATENSPLLLMDGTDFLEDNMRKAGVSRSDLIAKLREANVIHLSEVKAVILETTGDISVLHGTSDKVIDGIVMEGVVR